MSPSTFIDSTAWRHLYPRSNTGGIIAIPLQPDTSAYTDPCAYPFSVFSGLGSIIHFSTSINRNMRQDKIMKNASTITVERVTPKIVKIKFANPPVNLIIPETVTRLHGVVKELCEDEKVH